MISDEAALAGGDRSAERRIRSRTTDDEAGATQVHPFSHALIEEFAIEVPVYYWSATGQAILRISAQAYNSLAQYERLADALVELLARGA